MNNAKMWLVVSPTVGVPLFLAAVAVGSFSVHMQVVKNTTWVSDFLQGNEMGSGGEESAALQLGVPALEAAKASYVMPNGGAHEVTIILPDGTSAVGILKMPETLASAEAMPLAVTQ